jgi:hypothetical protein
MNPVDVLLIIISSFFSGAFLTAIGFVLGYSNRLTRVEDAVKALADKVPGQCPLHVSIDTRIDRLENKPSK